jgi:membrane protease YdiL (CAAX protease family)
MDRASRRNILEVALVFALIATFLWFGRGSFPGVNLVFAICLLAILGFAHRLAGEGLPDIGFRWDTFGPACRLLLPAVFIAAAAILAAAWLLDEMRFPPWEKAILRGTQILALGIAQQYVLVGFFFRRLERVTGSTLAPWLTALVFALLHLPNVFLAIVTFFAGSVACLIYRRAPNIWANGLAHGFLSVLLYYALPRSVTGGLRVGMEYLAALSG